MGYSRISMVDRFWAKVDVRGPDECWEWTGARYHDDYGVLGLRPGGGRCTTMRASAFALVLATQEDIQGRFALHHCDNPPCCNPAHLYWGDQKRNIADMDQRGRANRPVLKGMAHATSKLTDDDVRIIRQLGGRYSQQRIADFFGVSQPIVSSVLRGKTWTHVL